VESTTAPDRGRALVFLVMWAAQMVSLVGSVLAEFSLGVWVFQHTGSAALFALVSVCIIVPLIVFMPFAGVFADRYSRRLVMIVANLGGAATIGLLAVVVAAGALQVWLVYPATLLLSVFNVLLIPAYSASTPMLVPARHLSRANGLVQLAQNVPRLVGPPVAALLLVAVRLEGIVLVDLATFLFAAAALLPLAIPQPERHGDLANRRRIVREATDGLRYIVPRRSLLNLLVFFAVLNVTAGFVSALYQPLVLSFASLTDLGWVAAVSASGLLAGSVLMMVWKGPRRRVDGVLASGLVLGLAVVAIGSHAFLPSIALGGMTVTLCATIANVCNATLWQTKVPKEMLGRVLGSMRTITFVSIPFTLVVAGPLADRVFGPLLMPDGALAGSVGRLIGVGPGRGMGLLLILAGTLSIGNAVVGYLKPALRRLDEESADLPAAAVLSSV
jgi:DHA3 family macrolide efflux protein-like MFS transporter